MRRNLPIFLAVAVLAGAVSLFAAVTFTPSTGEGFVGRGDILSSLGKQAVASISNAEKVKFAFEDTTDYLIECEHNKTQKYQTFKRKRDLGGKVDADVRNNKNEVVNGFILEGYKGNVNLEPLTNPCEGNAFTLIQVTPLIGTGEANLTATYQGKTVTLPFTTP
jgi:hypothetical protein